MFNTIKTAFKNFVRNEEGASGIEYALVAAMVAVALAALAPSIKGKIGTIFTSILNALTSA